MVVDPRRDHKFKIPRPDLSVKLDIPNPCNRCHNDKSAQWAADKINEVHPSTKDKREKEIHDAEIFAAGQQDKPEAKEGLFTIINNRQKPAIIRASALNILSGFRGKDAIDVTALSLMDDDPLVRYEAVKGISSLIPKATGIEEQEKKYSLLVPLLKDPTLAVRSETARALTEVPATLYDQQDLEDFENALEEYIQRQESIEDRPEAHLNLGILYENMGDNEIAEASYKTAIELVNDFYPARFNLANFYNKLKRNSEAEQQFREIIKLDPEDGQAYYSLGLLLAELNRLDEAVTSMAKAVELMPDRARTRYNYALTLRHLGRNEDALPEMIKAHHLDQQDPGIVQAITIFYIQEKDWEKALPYAEKLVQLAPDADSPKQMLKQIKQQMSAE
jgi:Flp pilus assembly protein TadD